MLFHITTSQASLTFNYLCWFYLSTPQWNQRPSKKHPYKNRASQSAWEKLWFKITSKHQEKVKLALCTGKVTERKTTRPLQDLSGYERIRSRTKMRSIKMERMTPMVGRLYWLQGAKYTAVICLLTWDQIRTLWIEIKPFPLSQQFTKYKFCTSLSISLLLWFSIPFVLLLEGRISLLSLPNYILVPISHESNIILVWIIWSNATKTGSD